jgi:hypothetical protein
MYSFSALVKKQTITRSDFFNSLFSYHRLFWPKKLEFGPIIGDYSRRKTWSGSAF